MTLEPTPAGTPADRFGYFVLQVHTACAAGVRGLHAVVEDLATGEKRSFASANEIIGFLEGWANEEPPVPSAPP